MKNRALWPSRSEVFWLAVVAGVVGGVVGAVVVVLVTFRFPSGLDVALHPPPPTTGIASSGTARASFGGPYPIASTQLDNKEDEFNAIRGQVNGIDWDSSTTRELDRGLFENSIKVNSASGVPDATRYQRYNYVVKHGSIRVAIWTVSGPMATACNKVPVRDYPTATITKGVMVNFFPEDQRVPPPTPTGATPRKACPPTPPASFVAKKKELPGVLDAHSKHFMLAQEVDDLIGGKRLATLRDYVSPTSWSTWKDVEVDYAGEIIVDVAACYYIINNGSGTFTPPNGGGAGNFEYLLRVAQLFKDNVGVSPAAVWDPNSKVQVIKIPESGKPLRCA